MNYARIIDKQTGEVLGYLATEPGTVNEVLLVDKVHDMGLGLQPSTEEEYNNASGEEYTEVKPHWMENTNAN